MAMQTAIDGEAFRQLFQAGADCVEAHADAINALNVFPVPDGDTGVNMTLTLKAAMGTQPPASASVADVSQAISRGAILGARGNSGVILSQFLKGLAAGFSACTVCTGDDLRQALQAAADAGYQAVGTPVEGTMLTVMRAAADGAGSIDTDGDGAVADVLRAALAAAEQALALTPTQLPVLAEAGVVDAGGQGVVALLAGALAHLDGTQPTLDIAAPVGVVGGQGVSQAFLEHTEDDLYGYCTQFVVMGRALDPDAIRERVMAMAGSTVVVGDDEVVRVHAHAEDPGPLLSLGASLGALDQVNIANMDAQHQEFMARHGYTAAERSAQAVVAVVPSDGFDRLFRDQGAVATVAGGQTMNPSAADILNAVARANADHVLVLPNNPNIIMAARQAAELAECQCAVVPSRSAPQGIAAMLAFNPDADAAANLEAMTATLEGVRSGEVTFAIRTATIDGVAVREGEAIALLDGTLVCACATPSEALMEMLSRAGLDDNDLVTLYHGADRSADHAEADADAVRERWPGVEIELLEGGQPHYHYFVSIE